VKGPAAAPAVGEQVAVERVEVSSRESKQSDAVHAWHQMLRHVLLVGRQGRFLHGGPLGRQSLVGEKRAELHLVGTT
jgi:hypothetical protein